MASVNFNPTDISTLDEYALVTLQNPDGSEILFDDITPYALVGVTIQPDGGYKISTLHPGMSFPYE